jgi:2-methylcitrate dehydratase PrpD
MSDPDRRDFLTTLSLVGLAGLSAPVAAASVAPSPASQESAASAPPDVTRTLARYVLGVKYEDLPSAVRKEAQRTLLNWTGCAIGGSRHETVDAAIAALAPFSGAPQASVLGRRERMDVLHAALMNGISSHVFDFDDTHLKTVIHPAGPVASAILALSEFRPVSGKDFLTALVAGVEAEYRIGNAVYPAHYDRGWHITGTAGVLAPQQRAAGCWA